MAVPESRAPAVGALRMGEQKPVTDPQSDAEPASDADPAWDAKPPNRARQLLPKVNLQPWQEELPAVVQSANKDMQCSIGRDSAACHLVTEAEPRGADVRDQCTAPDRYHGGYAVVTLEADAQYGRCGNGISPMEAEAVAGPDFPGPWLQDGETVKVGNMVCERAPGTISCSHLQTGHGFLISQENYELW